MIQFCEDCGQKNIIDSTKIQDGKAVFQCSSCDYHNCFHMKHENRSYSDKLLELNDIIGVKTYIIVGKKDKIATNNIKSPTATAFSVFSCAQNSFAICKPDIKYVIFPKPNQQHFFIFQTENSYFGVIKQQNISTKTLTENILYFLKDLNKGRQP